MLDGRARFDDTSLAFDLEHPPRSDILVGRYHLISKSHARPGTGVDAYRGGIQSVFLYRLSHPLGEHVVEAAKALATPPVGIIFDVTNHPTRLHVIEALHGRTGYLTLTRLSIDSYEREEYLLFSGFDESGLSLDQETMEKLFNCAGQIARDSDGTFPAAVRQRLEGETERHSRAAVSRSLEQNNAHFNEAREKLERWADDMVLSAEKALFDTKEQIKVLAASCTAGAHDRRAARDSARTPEAGAPPASPAPGHIQGGGRDCRDARPARQLAGVPTCTASRNRNTVHHPLGGELIWRTFIVRAAQNPGQIVLNTLSRTLAGRMPRHSQTSPRLQMETMELQRHPALDICRVLHRTLLALEPQVRHFDRTVLRSGTRLSGSDRREFGSDASSPHMNVADSEDIV